MTKQFAAALDDPRDPDLTEHPFLEMVRARVYGILAGYADQTDHDTLRADPSIPGPLRWTGEHRAAAERTAFVAGAVSEEDTVLLTTALAGSGHPGVLLFDARGKLIPRRNEHCARLQVANA